MSEIFTGGWSGATSSVGEDFRVVIDLTGAEFHGISFVCEKETVKWLRSISAVFKQTVCVFTT